MRCPKCLEKVSKDQIASLLAKETCEFCRDPRKRRERDFERLHYVPYIITISMFLILGTSFCYWEAMTEGMKSVVMFSTFGFGFLLGWVIMKLDFIIKGRHYEMPRM